MPRQNLDCERVFAVVKVLWLVHGRTFDASRPIVTVIFVVVVIDDQSRRFVAIILVQINLIIFQIRSKEAGSV